ncbi:type VI secretion system contractile sheath small subunit [Sabulibacter ruber]|uniref:type VI secretion system contractile sheath small subunit n=1 Tax=Sabulibacter ruber TaxID=2811901 RepID=UPI001A95D0C3|nr:type VI secretion system contractile sheath small subunit [Sabulibacter ruber]
MPEELDMDIPGPIGIQAIEVEQSFTKINTNRTLVLTSLHSEGPYDPEVLPEEATVSLSKVFDFAKPSVEVELETGDEEEPTQEIKISYTNLKSFRPDDLEKRIPILQKQRAQEDRFQRIKAELERSKRLQEIIKDPEKKAAFLDILRSIQEELESA